MNPPSHPHLVELKEELITQLSSLIARSQCGRLRVWHSGGQHQSVGLWLGHLRLRGKQPNLLLWR